MKNIETISALHVIILALATFRITRFVVIDELFAPVRDWIWKAKSPSDSYIGYFLTCPWCVSLWVSLPLVFLYALNPSLTILIGCIFALSAISGLIAARLDD